MPIAESPLNPTIQNINFTFQISIVVFGTRAERAVDVQRTEGARPQTPLPSTTPLRFGYDVPQGGEAKAIFEKSIAWKPVTAIT